MQTARAILARNLRAIIKRRGYRTVELFAHENRMEKSWVHKILRQEIDPRFSNLVKLAKALGVDLNSLYPGKPKGG